MHDTGAELTYSFAPGSVQAMKLNMRTETTHYINYSDLEDYVKKVYGIDFEVVAIEEASNDSTLHFSVDGKIEDYDLDDMRKMLSGKWVAFSTRLLLNVMCANEEIPAGEYIIEISW